MRIGVIGVGVVGGAVLRGLSTKFECRAYDKFKPECGEFAHVLETDMVFVQVPTLTDKQTHNQDQAPLEEVLQKLSANQYKGVVVVKSTVVPMTCERMAEKYGLRIVHNPEFLTAAKPYEDFMNQPVIVLGGDTKDAIEVGNMFQLVFPTVEVVYLPSSTHSELIKYFHNCFLSVKVAFCNEMWEVCRALGVDYDSIKDTAVMAGGIGPGHTKVPGPDGLRGFGGMCFPKDTKAFNKFANDISITMRTLEAAIMGNYQRRGE